MYPPCEVVGRHILPVFRSLIAKELIQRYGFTQVEAAKRVGTTQAAVSQYIHSKRGFKRIEQFDRVLPMIQDAASETAKRIATEKLNSDEVVLSFCRLCGLLQREITLTG